MDIIRTQKEIRFGSFVVYAKTVGILEGEGEITKEIFLNSLLSFTRNYRNVRIEVFGIPIYSKKIRTREIRRILGIPVYYCKGERSFRRYMEKNIGDSHDYILISRHNIGETTIYLMYISEWIQALNAKRPAVLVWRQRDVEFYSMFLKEKCDMVRFDVSQWDINFYLKKTYTRIGNSTIVCPTYDIAGKMKAMLPLQPRVNFVTMIMSSMSISHSLRYVGDLYITEKAKSYVETQIIRELENRDFVLFCPEATTLKKMPAYFWDDLYKIFVQKGYSVVFNTTTDLKKMSNSIKRPCKMDELYYLATRSSGIISLASGLGVLLSLSQVKCDLLYTDFNEISGDFKSSLVKRLYSVKHLPCNEAVNDIYEWDVEDFECDELVDMISSRYPDVSSK
jgi:hypothetical protein